MNSKNVKSRIHKYDSFLSCVHIEKDDYSTSAAIDVHLSQNKIVYMNFNLNQWNDDDRCVVLVDAKKFLDIWCDKPSGKIAIDGYGCIEEYRFLNKYPKTIESFSKGKLFPVPLAKAVFINELKYQLDYKQKFCIFKIKIGHRKVNFSSIVLENGITRTVWLYEHGAKYFPVESTYTNNAKKMADLVGYEGMGKNLISASDLLKIDE